MERGRRQVCADDGRRRGPLLLSMRDLVGPRDTSTGHFLCCRVVSKPRSCRSRRMGANCPATGRSSSTRKAIPTTGTTNWTALNTSSHTMYAAQRIFDACAVFRLASRTDGPLLFVSMCERRCAALLAASSKIDTKASTSSRMMVRTLVGAAAAVAASVLSQNPSPVPSPSRQAHQS